MDAALEFYVELLKFDTGLDLPKRPAAAEPRAPGGVERDPAVANVAPRAAVVRER